MKIVSFGEILLRLASPGYTRLFQRDNLNATFCGGEANVAVSLAIWGLKSVFVTKLPDSAVGHAAANSMQYFGVNTDSIIYGKNRMGLYYLEKGASQRPSNIIYDRAYSDFALSKRNDFDWDKIFEDADWFHWTGINPALGGDLPIICEDACKAAKAKGITISCDLNYRKNLWSSEKAQMTFPKYMSYIDVCIANEEDTDKVLGIKPANNEVKSGSLNRMGYESAAKQICSIYGCKKIAFTLRESFSASRNGWSALLFDAFEQRTYYSRHYDIHIIDRVGAGDSFAAGIIYSLSTNKDNQNTIEFATAASCLKHTIEGDYNRVTTCDVENLLADGGNGRIQR